MSLLTRPKRMTHLPGLAASSRMKFLTEIFRTRPLKSCVRARVRDRDRVRVRVRVPGGLEDLVCPTDRGDVEDDLSRVRVMGRGRGRDRDRVRVRVRVRVGVRVR